jgi:hypothetical protein
MAAEDEEGVGEGAIACATVLLLAVRAIGSDVDAPGFELARFMSVTFVFDAVPLPSTGVDELPASEK